MIITKVVATKSYPKEFNFWSPKSWWL